MTKMTQEKLFLSEREALFAERQFDEYIEKACKCAIRNEIKTKK